MVDIGGRAPKDLGHVGAVGHQTAARGKVTKRVDRRHAVVRRQRDERIAMVCHAKVRQHYQTPIRFARERIEHAIEVVGSAHSGRDRRHREGGRRGLDRPQEQVGERRAVRVEDERDPRDVRRGLLERLQPFGSDRELEAGEAGEIAARMRQVRHEALADRVGHLREHDWHDLALLPQRGRHRRAVGQDQVGRHGEQLRRVVAQYIFSAAGPAVLDPRCCVP